jgi:50S ribosomal protein L16 3-hydroxylase
MYRLVFPEGLGPEEFLRSYWQKRPLLMPAALPGWTPPLGPEELAGLACEDGVESRIVLAQEREPPWLLRHGPFREADFDTLPERRWTLLVQDVDKFVPEVAELLEAFRFLPDWRVDDIMISYAADGGSVGPHRDEYDVFLVQGAGRRRWSIHQHPAADDELLPGLDLRILARFEADEEWVLEPGDLIYLPPGVAHWGLAEGEGCMTYSVGFRAPTLNELVTAYCDDLVRRTVGDERYRDADDLTPVRDPAEISPQALRHLSDLLDRALSDQPEERDRWAGRFFTEPKPHLQVEPRDQPLEPRALHVAFERHGLLIRNGLSRLAFVRGRHGKDYLYANGEELGVPSRVSGLLEALSHHRRLHFGYLAGWLDQPGALQLLTELYNRGHLELPDE